MLENLRNSPHCPVISRFVRCIFSGQDVEFNYQKEMQGGIYGKENNGQIDSRIA